MGDASPDTPVDPVRLPTYAVLRADFIGQAAYQIAAHTTPETARAMATRIADRVLPTDYVAELDAVRDRLLSSGPLRGEASGTPEPVRLPTYTVLRADLIGKAAFRISGLTGVPALESPTREIAHQIADAVLPVDYVASLNAERGRLYRAVDRREGAHP